ncbi:MAG: hypothetical protein Fur0041_11260 [Bacteroidia bacterium]
MKKDRKKESPGPASPVFSDALKKPSFLASALVLMIALFITYSNHFQNPFHFDDSHTIVNNVAIRDMGNLHRFFTDATTSSTLPANQAWRPGVTTLNAIDTWISGGTPDSFYFHISIFISYIILGVLLFFFFLHILKKLFPSAGQLHWIALFATGFFWLHTANAETINYIIARSDSFSTLMILTAWIMYLFSEKSKKYYLYLIPVIIGFLVKEVTFTFAPILLVYALLFEKKEGQRIQLQHFIASFGILVALFIISRVMTPENWKSGGGEWYWYMFTQAFVIVHYFFTFILPVNLSADTDWTTVTSVTDDRVMIGILFIGALVYAAVACSRHNRTKGITFGIAWFLLALAPTSSIFPFAEVMNDHRIFYPFIGLIIAGMNIVALILEHSKTTGRYALTRNLTAGLMIIVMCAHAAGTHHRNDIWSSGEKLWKDVTEKSPGNGRGWMNYGLALMAKGDMQGAIDNFNKGLQIYPNYSYLHINMGIALNVMKKPAEAESHYRTAISVDSLNPEGYYYYGLFLMQNQRMNEAISILNKGKQLSPMHEGINTALAPYASGGNILSPLDAAKENAKKNPTPENYIALSLAYYNNSDYLNCAAAAEEAARIKPDYGIAWNNICAAYNKAGEFEKALEAGKKAVALQPNDELSKNNLKEAQTKSELFSKLESDAKANPTYPAYITLSLQWYNAGNFSKSLEAAQKATELKPDDPAGWNNVCAAANKLRQWDIAIEAGEKALKIDPNSELYKNNLAEARKGKAEQK